MVLEFERVQALISQSLELPNMGIQSGSLVVLGQYCIPDRAINNRLIT